MKRKAPHIPLPRNWPAHVDAAVEYAAIVYTRSWCSDSPFERVKLAGRLEESRDATTVDNACSTNTGA